MLSNHTFWISTYFCPGVWTHLLFLLFPVVTDTSIVINQTSSNGTLYGGSTAAFILHEIIFPPSLHVNDALLCFLSSFVLFLLPFHFGWNHLTISGCFYLGFMQKAVPPVVVCITDCFFYHMSNDCINYHLCNCSSHWAELNVMSVMPHGFNSCENPLFAYFYASEQILRPLWGLGETND